MSIAFQCGTECSFPVWEAAVGPLLPWGPSHAHSAQAGPQHIPLHLSSPSPTISLLDCGIPPYNSGLGLNSLSHTERGPPDLHQTLSKKKATAWACLVASSWTSQESYVGCLLPAHLLLFIISASWWCLSSASHIPVAYFLFTSDPLLTTCFLSALICRYPSVFTAGVWLSR